MWVQQVTNAVSMERKIYYDNFSSFSKKKNKGSWAENGSKPAAFIIFRSYSSSSAP
jgi:hypothetical protein